MQNAKPLTTNHSNHHLHLNYKEMYLNSIKMEESKHSSPFKENSSFVDFHFKGMMDFLNNLSRPFLVSMAFIILLLVGLLNYFTGPILSTWILYLIPIFLLTWFAGRWLGILTSIISSTIWLIADYSSGVTYSDHSIPIWNFTARLCSFIILTLILSALKDAIEKEKELSRIDFLTRVGNSRYFIELTDMEIDRARRYGHPLTVVYIDLDNFKSINDRFGHSTGDYLLRLVANTIKNNIRLSDTVARLGGDEFAILLPETGPELAEAITRKVQKINLEIMERNGWPVTFSIGVVTFIHPPSTVDEILRISDNLMYNAKNNGKNTVKYEVTGIKDWSSVTVA